MQAANLVGVREAELPSHPAFLQVLQRLQELLGPMPPRIEAPSQPQSGGTGVSYMPLLVLLGLVGGGIAWLAAGDSTARPPLTNAPSASQGQQAGTPAREAPPVRGPLRIVTYLDFQSPFCARFDLVLKQMKQKYGKQLQIVPKQYPLEMHREAELAAKAALAARAQGRYQEYHDKLLSEPQALGLQSLRRYAQEIGLDLARFESDLNSSAIESRGLLEGTPRTASARLKACCPDRPDRSERLARRRPRSRRHRDPRRCARPSPAACRYT